jgi:hypothetical protein
MPEPELATEPVPVEILALIVVLPEPFTIKFLFVADIAPETLTNPTPELVSVVLPESVIEVSASPMDDTAPIATVPDKVTADAAVAVNPPA